jgi:hypothetical protein
VREVPKMADCTIAGSSCSSDSGTVTTADLEASSAPSQKELLQS